MSDNSGFTLPLVYKAGPDLIGKIILSDKRAMNAMTLHLVGASEDTYHVASTGFMRSPMNCVLYIANPESAYPPIVVNITEKVDTNYINEVIRRCTEIYERHALLPRCIIVGTEEIDQIILDTSINKNIPFARETRCDLWATDCLLVSKDAMFNQDDPRHPLIDILNGVVKYKWVCLSEDGLTQTSGK